MTITYIITKPLDGYPHYWTGLGWVRDIRSSRKYSESEARLKMERMQKDGNLGVMIQPR